MKKYGERLFENGMSFEEFINLDHNSYREKILEIYNSININKELKNKIKNINRKINILICAEMWCPDCIINVPVIEKIRQLNKNIKISIVEKDGNEEFFKKYSYEESVKIPTFVFYDEEFDEIGSFIERPSYIKEVQNSNNQPLKIVTMRKYKKGEYVEETLKDIMNIISMR